MLAVPMVEADKWRKKADRVRTGEATVLRDGRHRITASPTSFLTKRREHQMEETEASSEVRGIELLPTPRPYLPDLPTRQRTWPVTRSTPNWRPVVQVRAWVRVGLLASFPTSLQEHRNGCDATDCAYI
jgi:hypothetical protein